MSQLVSDGIEFRFSDAASRAASMLDEFHTHPNPLPETNHPGLRRTLLAEEHLELLEALELGDPAKIARELADVLYVLYGTAWVHGIDLDGFQPPDMTAATDGAAALVAARRGGGPS